MIPSKVCIIILNWNGKKDTIACLHSLQDLDRAPGEIIVVDNGSTDGSVGEIHDLFPQVTLLETGENLGYAGGNNVGIEFGMRKGYEFFFLLNNDTTVHPKILEEFLAAFVRNPEAGILGAKIYLMSDPKRFDHFGGKWNPKGCAFDFIGYREMDDGRWDMSQELDYVCGAAMMVHRSVFEKIGVFDPRFFLYWEEADLCFRARKMGFKVVTAPGAIIWHKVSASITSKPFAAYFFWRNRLLWIEKNFHGTEKFFYLSRLLGKSLPHLYVSKGIRVLKSLLGKNSTAHRDKILRYDAQILAVHDYLRRNFGSGNLKKFQ